MICYRDMTFCPADDCTKRGECDSYLSQQVKDDAARWWGGKGATIAVTFEPFPCYEKEKNK